jgi:hypothetical protein
VLKIYTECGLYDIFDVHGNPVATKLKTSGVQEAVVFSETHCPIRGVRAALYARREGFVEVGYAGKPWYAGVRAAGQWGYKV